MNTPYEKLSLLLEYAGLKPATAARFLGQGVHNDGYYVKSGRNEYCIRIARYEGKRGLIREADALQRLPQGIAPELVFFHNDTAPIDRLWTIATYIDGVKTNRLSLGQFKSLGTKLARVHAIEAPGHDIVDAGEVTGDKTDLWEYLLWSCRSFYDDSKPVQDTQLSNVMTQAKFWLGRQQSQLSVPKTKFLLHKDIGVGNIVTKGDDVFIIDWEDREFGDPMSDFATGFWDIAQAGRIVLSDKERAALYDGYQAGGGSIDEDRIMLWVTFDKLVVAQFFYNRIYSPKDDATQDLLTVYKDNLEEIITSLNKTFDINS